MPFKIYTYEDPYKLDHADFWDEISVLPHFCSARTLVNGLINVFGDKIKGLICPLDNLINHKEVYKPWTDNISLRIQQYSMLTSTFRQLNYAGEINDKFYQALQHNQNHFLESIRLFIELGIPASALDETKGNPEQRLFVRILNEVQSNSLFQFPITPNQEKLKKIMIDIACQEVIECRGTHSEKQRCEKAVEITKGLPLNSIVVHGVHQFSPVQLRLLIEMDKMGFTIIFLFNYQKKYSKIYSSWDKIYGRFEVPIRHDSVVQEYQMPTMQNPSNALACALGRLCQDGMDAGNSLLREWYQLYQSIEFIEFANITEYAHFISNHFNSAIRRYAETLGVVDRGNDVWNHSAVLRYLDEQVYTASREIHTLLKIYYPEYAKERHFLSYPIGQFFSAIYRLWDYKQGEIIIDSTAIKECLSSNILNSAPGEELLRTFYNLEVFFEHITTFREFKQKIANEYVRNYNRVAEAKSTETIFNLKRLSIYNKYKVTKRDIQNLVKAIEEINEIAKYLFGHDQPAEDYVNFGKYFKNLEDFLKQRELTLANEQERALIQALQHRLEEIKPEETTFSGTFQDLKQGLYYYLSQKRDEEQNVDWIVKNFEQIDGDILLSKEQFEREEKKTYHFACLSDRDMNLTVNDLLPWPLTDEFIQTSYSPVDLQFQVYYTVLEERSNFLRYALFYGLCYNRCNVRLSFVKQYEEETTGPYSLLSILGLMPKSGLVEDNHSFTHYTISVNATPTKDLKYDLFQMMDMYLCPHRYLLDYVLEDAPVIQGSFLYQKYYENLLIDAVWKRIGGQQKSKAEKHLTRIIDEENHKLEPYFGFWQYTEFFDLKLRAQNYLIHNIIRKSKNTTVAPYSPLHMQIRKLFGKAMFVTNISEAGRKNPYGRFESLTNRKYPNKEYSLHRLPKSDVHPTDKLIVNALLAETLRYINHSGANTAIPAEWCTYCVHRGNCLEPYLTSEQSPN